MSSNIRDILYFAGKAKALDMQKRAPDLDGTALYEEEEDIPLFTFAKKNLNMLERNCGFVCKTSAGRIVRLIQKYDSDTFPSEPEDLPSQWGFVWSKDPKKALPFISIATSPYMMGDCCKENGIIYVSIADNNVFSPSEYPDWWKLAVGEAEVKETA